MLFANFTHTGRGRSVAEDRRKKRPNIYLEKFMKRVIEISRTALILPKHHFFELAESYAEDLRTFVRNHEQLRPRIPVNDPSVTADLDTQEEYAHWHSSASLPGRR